MVSSKGKGALWANEAKLAQVYPTFSATQG